MEEKNIFQDRESFGLLVYSIISLFASTLIVKALDTLYHFNAIEFLACSFIFYSLLFVIYVVLFLIIDLLEEEK